MILLTVVSDIDGSTRSENSENTRVIEASGVCGAVIDLVEAGTGSISVHVCPTTGWVIYLGAIEQGARANGISDAEAVFREGAQDTTRIVKKFEGFIASVMDCRDDLQVH